MQSPLQAFKMKPTVLETYGSISVSQNNIAKIGMLFQHFSDLKAMSVNVHHCLRKTKNSESMLQEGFISAVRFQMPLRQPCTVAKLAVLLLRFQHEKHEKGKSLSKRLKECSEVYV